MVWNFNQKGQFQPGGNLHSVNDYLEGVTVSEEICLKSMLKKKEVIKLIHYSTKLLLKFSSPPEKMYLLVNNSRYSFFCRHIYIINITGIISRSIRENEKEEKKNEAQGGLQVQV